MREAFRQLRGYVLRARLSGFTEAYTEMLLTTLFGVGRELDFTTPCESAWPPREYSRSAMRSPSFMGSEFQSPRTTFQLFVPPSPNFAQSFEEEMMRYESTSSVEYTMMIEGHTSMEDRYYGYLEEGLESHSPLGFEAVIVSPSTNSSDDGLYMRRRSTLWTQPTIDEEVILTNTVDSDKVHSPVIVSSTPDGGETPKASSPHIQPPSNNAAPSSTVEYEQALETIVAIDVLGDDLSPTPKSSSLRAQSTLSHVALIGTVDGAPVSEAAAPSTYPSDEAAPTATPLTPQPLCLNNKFSTINILQDVEATLAQNLAQEIPPVDSGSLDTTDPTEAQIHLINNEIDLGTNLSTERSLLTPSPNQASGCIGSTSPNTMNEINEKDPAFLRTVKALQSTDNTPKLAGRYRPYSYASPDKVGPDIPITVGGRSMTSAGCRSQSDGTKRKYSFLDMLRGRRGTS